jgi:hypothetical protein
MCRMGQEERELELTMLLLEQYPEAEPLGWSWEIRSASRRGIICPLVDKERRLLVSAIRYAIIVHASSPRR